MEEPGLKIVCFSSEKIEKPSPLYLNSTLLDYILNGEGISICPNCDEATHTAHSRTCESSDRRDLQVIIRLLLVNPSKKNKKRGTKNTHHCNPKKLKKQILDDFYSWIVSDIY